MPKQAEELLALAQQRRLIPVLVLTPVAVSIEVEVCTTPDDGERPLSGSQIE
jgi:hypothetical protein